MYSILVYTKFLQSYGEQVTAKKNQVKTTLKIRWAGIKKR